MKHPKHIIALCFLAILASCSESGQFTGWQTEEFAQTAVTESVTKTFALVNNSEDREQHITGITFDRGSNAAGHFRMERLMVGEVEVQPNDIVIPPKSSLKVTVTYAPMNLQTSEASYGGWETGKPKRFLPKHPDDVGKEDTEPVIHRAIIEAIFDYPGDGIFFVQLVGEAVPGPGGEEEAGGAFATCAPGDGVACYTGGFALDIPKLAPGGPKELEITGPIRFNITGGAATMRMDDFPFVIYLLRSSDIPQLPTGVTATLVLSGSQGVEAQGTFDGARISIKGISFRIRVALGELTVDQIKQGMSAMVDFDLSDLEIETIKPLNQGAITMKLETTIPENPSGNELFDQFLSGAEVTAIMEGELAF